MTLKFKQLAIANKKRCEHVYHPIEEWSITDWACALAGECGEACNYVKKMRRDSVDYKEEIGKELADLVCYADLLAQRLGLDLGKCVESKFNEISDRIGSSIKL